MIKDMTQDQITHTLRKHFDDLADEYGVARIGIFGSYATKTALEGSDIDLVIEFSKPIGFRFVELAEYLEQLLGKRVDILTPDGLEGIRVQRVAKEIQDTLIYV